MKALFLFLPRLFDPHGLKLEHVGSDVENDKSAGNAEGLKRYSEKLEDEVSGDGKKDQDEKSGETSFGGNLRLLFGGVVQRERQKCGGGPQRIEDHKKSWKSNCNVFRNCHKPGTMKEAKLFVKRNRVNSLK